MKRMYTVSVLTSVLVLIAAVHAAERQKPSDQVQQQLIALDKQWGEAGANSAVLDKILADNMLAIGPNGEVQGKQEQIAAGASAAAETPAGSYSADEYKFEMLNPDVVVMTHRGRTMQGGKVTESHRSLHVFQRKSGAWQVVANAQVPIPQQ